MDYYKQAIAKSNSEKVMKLVVNLQNEDLSWLSESINEEWQKQGKIYGNEQCYPLKLQFKDVNIDVAKFLENEFRKFVLICLIYPDEDFAPASALDMYWHTFILHTRQYHDFCDRYFGSYKHHEPATKESQPKMLDAYKHTLERYEEIFGKLDDSNSSFDNPSRIWWNASSEPKICILSA